jgi:hypothetical protein
MASRTGLAVAVVAAMFAAACSSPPDNQTGLQETAVPLAIEETATPPPTVETLSDTLDALAQTLRDAVLAAPPDWPTRDDFELAISGYIGPSVADQVDLFLRYHQYASVYAASACVEGISTTSTGFYSFIGRMVTAGRDTGVVLAEGAASAIVSLVSDAGLEQPCVGRYTKPDTVSEAVLAVGVVEAIMMANDPARLPWEVEAEVYSTALEWFAEPRDTPMLEWVCEQIGERACLLQGGG